MGERMDAGLGWKNAPKQKATGQRRPEESRRRGWGPQNTA